MATNETAILQSDSKEKIKLLLRLAKELGIKSRVLSAVDAEDYFLSLAIDKGMKTSDVALEEVMKALKQ